MGDERHRALADGTIDLTSVGRPQSIAEGREAGAFVVWKYDNPDGCINMETVTNDLRWWEQEGVLPRPVPVDQIVNHSNLEEALAVLGRYQSHN